MYRETLSKVLSWFALLVLPMVCRGQGSPLTDREFVRLVMSNERKNASAEAGKAVIGSLAAEGHGHVVVVVPGSPNVWDGNALGGFKDLVAGKSISYNSVLARMESFVNRQFPADIVDVRKTKPQNWKNATAGEKQAY
jgi:hypothetical protein